MNHHTYPLIAVFCLFSLMANSVPTLAQDQQEPDYLNTQKLAIPFTPADQALSLFQLPQGFQASLFAAEPDVQQPIAVATDARGRLWVVECYTYSDRKTNYDMSVKDRVVIFEDTDNDGRHDKRTVFWDQGEKLTGIEVGFGGVWLTSAPNFIFLPDRDGNDKPDGPPEVLLNGFEDNVIRHNIVNGLRWGPDGWLYGRHGIQATSFVGPPKATDSQRTPMNCSIWRFHPIERTFEIVAEGGTNPWGFDYDEHGEMFMINTVIGHLFHVVPGARYRRMYGAHFNPHTYQVIEQTADHFHFAQGEDWNHVREHGISSETDNSGGGHAHTGLMIYQGGNWPDKYHNSLFTANFHGLRINRDTIERAGNGYVGKHASDILKTSDKWFRGVELTYGPDGGVYLLDWSDIGECHENDGIHRTSGRIYKFIYGNPQPPSQLKPVNEANELQLVDYLSHENDWYSRKARRELQERAADRQPLLSAKKALHQIFAMPETEPRRRLRAMWALYSMDNLDILELVQLTHDPSEHVRAWAVRLIFDGRLRITDSAVQRLIELAATDPSGLVRLYLASGLSRLDFDNRFRLAESLVAAETDAADRTQPHLIWFGIEPSIVWSPERSVALARKCKIPLVRQNIARRLAFENENPQCRNAISAWLDDSTSDEEFLAIIVGMDEALTGWGRATPPVRWTRTSSKLAKSNPELAESLARLNIVFGDGASLDQLKMNSLDSARDALARSRAIESVANAKPTELFQYLKSLAGDKSVLTQVVKSLVHCDEPEVAQLIINKFGNCDQAGKQAAISTLISRPEWALKLLDAIERKRIPVSMIQAWHARKISQFEDAVLSEKLARTWGEIRKSDEKKLELMRRLAANFTIEKLASSDHESGKNLFEKNCATCHVLYGTGSRIGPDLTGSDRKNLNYLIENMIDPSSFVAESYLMKIFLLDDGRTVSGSVLNENSRTIEIQTPDEIVTIRRDSIETERKTKLSLMPDGILDKLSETERVDLFGYLMSDY